MNLEGREKNISSPVVLNIIFVPSKFSPNTVKLMYLWHLDLGRGIVSLLTTSNFNLVLKLMLSMESVRQLLWKSR